MLHPRVQLIDSEQFGWVSWNKGFSVYNKKYLCCHTFHFPKRSHPKGPPQPIVANGEHSSVAGRHGHLAAVRRATGRWPKGFHMMHGSHWKVCRLVWWLGLLSLHPFLLYSPSATVRNPSSQRLLPSSPSPSQSPPVSILPSFSTSQFIGLWLSFVYKVRYW